MDSSPAHRRRRQGSRAFARPLRALLYSVMGMFLAAFAFVGGFAAFSFHVAGLSTPTDPKPADAIIVLTGGHSRLDAAVDLLKSGKGRRLLISGVNPIARVADLQLATGGDARLFSCCVDIDHVALDTIGNAEESAKWVSSHSYGSVILVTNNYHMPRSLLEMQRLLAGAELQPYPVVNTSLTGTEWLSRPKALRVLLTEYTKYLAAVARGLLPRPSLPETPSIEASASAMVMD